jgi:hypothetical protein
MEKKNALIKHKKFTFINEESGPIIENYNALITHLESKLVA